MAEFRKEVFYNSLYRIIISIINRIGALILAIYLARVLLPEAFGFYSLTIAIAMIAFTVAELGVNTALSKYVSEEISKGNKKKAAAYARYLIKIKLTLMAISSCVLLIISYPLAFYFYKKPELFLPLIFASIFIFVFALEGLFSTFFYALKKVRYLNIKEFFSQILRISIVILIFSITQRAFYVSGAMIAQIIASILMASLLIYWLKKIAPTILKKSNAIIDKTSLKRFVLFLSIGTISAVFFANVDTLMIGWLIQDTSYVGFYRAAFSIVISIGELLFLNLVFIPIFAQLKKNNFNEMFNKVMKYSFMMTIPAAFGIIALRNYIIRLIYGYEYLPAALPLIFLSFLIIDIASGGLIFSALSAKGKIEKATKIMASLVFLNIALNFVFISYFLKYSPIMGAVGAAIATIITRFSYFTFLIFNIKKEINATLQLKSIIKPLIASTIMLLSLLWINSQIKNMTLILGCLEILAGIVIYFAILLVISGFSREDLLFFKEIVKKVGK